jgi:hypothetical protein
VGADRFVGGLRGGVRSGRVRMGGMGRLGI